MNPIVRELHPHGKAVSIGAFAVAVLAAGYGLFTQGPMQVFSLVFPPGTVPAFVFVALVVGVVTARRSLGEERCRRCRCGLQSSRVAFPRNARDRVVNAVESGDASRLGGIDTDDGYASVGVELRYCPRCCRVTVVQARGSDGGELTAEHVIVGPDVAEWIGLRESR